MATTPYWIEAPWPGRLAIVARPRGNEWLADEVDDWRQVGLDVIVSLLTRSEAILPVPETAAQRDWVARFAVPEKMPVLNW